MFFNNDDKINRRSEINSQDIFIESDNYLDFKKLHNITSDKLADDIKKTQLLKESSTRSYIFIHTTIQEYLAALYISRLKNHTKRKLFVLHILIMS